MEWTFLTVGISTRPHFTAVLATMGVIIRAIMSDREKMAIIEVIIQSFRGYIGSKENFCF